MRVLHLSSFDLLGGASRAAYRLHQGLRIVGVDSQMLVSNKYGNDPAVRALDPDRHFMSRLKRRWRRRLIRQSKRPDQSGKVADVPFSDDRSPWGNDIARQLPPSDLINLHWISGFIDLQNLFTHLPSDLPAVWTLHDMYAFTGGCHYDNGCGRFSKSCGACPVLGSFNKSDLSNQIWLRKRDALMRLGKKRLTVVAPSRWLASEASHSSLLSAFPIRLVHYGLDTQVFAPRDRAFSRNVFSIPQEAHVVLFTAHSITDKRKGFDFLVEAIAGLDNIRNILLVSIGGANVQVPRNVPYQHLGVINDDRLLALAYNAADIFVIPSLQENLPQTALEAIACGIPVVGFDVGGVPDVVRPGLTGLLAAPSDAQALRQTILQLLEDQDMRARMTSSCREIAIREFALDQQAQTYLNLYSELLATRMVA